MLLLFGGLRGMTMWLKGFRIPCFRDSIGDVRLQLN
jgi:hypothetical protein